MKRLKVFILLPVLFLLSCERDDICAASTPTTPLLQIEFFDFIDTDTQKTVTRLSVYAERLVTDDNGVVIPPENASSASIVFNDNSDVLTLPLIVGEDGAETTTRYIFERDTNLRIEDDDDTTQSNIDIVEITYISEYVYVSRACGYKSIFTNLTIQVDETNDDDVWVSGVDYLGTEDNNITVENQNETHVRILH